VPTATLAPLQAAGFIMWTPRLLAGDYIAGRYATDSCWTAGALCLGLAGFLASRGQTLAPPRAEDLRRRALLPTAAFLISLLLLPVLVLVDASVPVRPILQGGIIAAGICFVTRLWLIARGEREAAGAARAARDELDRFFALSSEMLAVVSLDGRLKRANPALERVSGHTAAELASRTLGEFSHPDDRRRGRLWRAARRRRERDVRLPPADHNRPHRDTGATWATLPPRHAGLGGELYGAGGDGDDGVARILVIARRAGRPSASEEAHWSRIGGSQ
jgi:PAS domain-containing protein